MTFIKPYLIVVKTLMFFLFDSIVLWKSKSTKRNKLKLVLLIRQDAIGDFVIWLDTAKEYRILYPPEKYKIVLIGNDLWYDLAKTLPYWDEVLPVNVKQFKAFSLYRKNLLRKVRSLGAQITVQTAFSGEFYLADSLVRASNSLRKVGSVGDMSNRNWFKKIISDSWYTELVPASTKQLTELERNTEFFRGFSKKTHQLSYPNLSSIILASSTEWEKRDYYVLFPGASTTLKQWPIGYFAEIANRIYKETCLTGILDGVSSEKPLAESIQGLTDAPLEWAGTSLNEMPKLLKHSKFLVSNDTSAVHIAVAVNTPVICILGGAYYGRFLPYPELPDKQFTLETVSYSMPCYGCNGDCIYPLKKNDPAPCITNISVDAVWEKISSLLPC